MPINEFSLIEQYFNQQAFKCDDVILGIGDDAAICKIPKHKKLAIAIDTLVSGVHFLPEWPADVIAHKSLAVNLSDLAAMGATPSWFTLALTLPESNECWLAAFSKGLFRLADQYECQLIGGDTTRGPLSITIQVAGLLEQPLMRSQAEVGDLIVVSGQLGAAAAGLAIIQNQIELQEPFKTQASEALLTPQPRIALGKTLSTISNCAIDISDGLLADLNHICESSDSGATIYLNKLPLFEGLKSLDEKTAWEYALCHGDDYELIFTIKPPFKLQLEKLSQALDLSLTVIGEITSGNQVICLDQHDQNMEFSNAGYRHF